jgi:eukaryotic-like serine/threonine-protein kinase
MELLDGRSLADRLKDGPVPPLEAAGIVADVAAGLERAHAAGVLHRDVKPANIVFAGSIPKLVDFGIARSSALATMTKADVVLGTAAYISPEQAQGLPATAASDVYSFGVILYRLLSGQLPFESESAIELARMHIHERPAPLAEVRPGIPSALAALADASLAKDPGERPPDGSALVDALSAGSLPLDTAATIVADSRPTLVIPPGGPGERGRRPVPLPLVLAGLLLLAGGAVGVGAAVLLGRSNDSTPATSIAHTRAKKTTTATPITSPQTARTSTAASTRGTTTAPTTVAPPPPPPPPTPPPPTPPPPTLPPPPTTLPTTVTIPVTTPPPPPPPPPP